MCPGGWEVLVEYYDSLAPNESGRVPQAIPAWVVDMWHTSKQARMAKVKSLKPEYVPASTAKILWILAC